MANYTISPINQNKTILEILKRIELYLQNNPIPTEMNVVDVVEDGNANAVSSNAVYDAIQNISGTSIVFKNVTYESGVTYTNPPFTVAEVEDIYDNVVAGKIVCLIITKDTETNYAIVTNAKHIPPDQDNGDIWHITYTDDEYVYSVIGGTIEGDETVSGEYSKYRVIGGATGMTLSAGYVTETNGFKYYRNQLSLDMDSTPTENSTKPITSGGVYDALSTVKIKLTYGSGNTLASNFTESGIYFISRDYNGGGSYRFNSVSQTFYLTIMYLDLEHDFAWVGGVGTSYVMATTPSTDYIVNSTNDNIYAIKLNNL